MIQALKDWLDPLDGQAKVECDGMTRLISHLLTKNDIEHLVNSGVLVDTKRINDPEVGLEEPCGVTHFWIELNDGHFIDYRARMWMGNEAPHGVFVPSPGRFAYHVHDRIVFNELPEPILSFMSGLNVSDWPLLSRS